MSNSIWTLNSSSALANVDTSYDASTRIEQKRAYEWVMDATAHELFFSKKQAIESGSASTNDLGCDSPCSQSGGLITDRFFSPKPVHYYKNDPQNVSAETSVQKKELEEQFRNDSAICLSTLQAMEAPSYLNTGLRKVKVNEVRISENCAPEFSQMTGHDMFPGSSYNTAAANNMIDKDYTSTGPESSKSSGSLMLSNQFYGEMNSNNLLSVGTYCNRGSYSIKTMADQNAKENGSILSVSPTYGNGPESLFAMGPFYNTMNEAFMSSGSTYNMGPTGMMSVTSSQIQEDTHPAIVPLGTIYSTENSSILSMVRNAKKGEQTTISFGGFQDNPEESDPSGTIYNNFLTQSSAQSSGASGLKDAIQQLNKNAATSTTDGSNKNKEQKAIKKTSSNNFPSNVKSLLSTGILDGVPVKYVSWSREKNLRGVVRGTGYLCSCEDCKLSKAINAYEFERHAGCKTKHPNNHIYFENGKTIYAVVQELKSTPQDLLFDVMQTVTGSPINQKKFQAWKESFQAAARELQRIYGRGGEVTVMHSA